jgi:N-terminal domain of Peptidase_S41 in eukaryotic IRBP
MPSLPGNAAALVDALLAKVRQHYLFPDKVEPIEAAIRRRLADGAYDAIGEPAALCEALTADLRAASANSHFPTARRASRLVAARAENRAVPDGGSEGQPPPSGSATSGTSISSAAQPPWPPRKRRPRSAGPKA